MESDIVSGQQSAWVLLKKLGEGDAGEVYLVESLLDKHLAILKRPVRSAFAGDVIRQTAQITLEGRILKALSSALKMDSDFFVSVPELIDQSRPGTAFSDRMFIIIEKARGFDLAFLGRAAHLGTLSGADIQADSAEEKHFLHTLAENGRLPDRILLSVLNTLLLLFEKIHARTFDVEGIPAYGILWNDVKAEHLYWDPVRARIMIIDWGNGQLLEQDGTTRDRRYSAVDDYRQFLDEMGRFLETASPALLSRLGWPGRSSAENPAQPVEDPQAITALQERVWAALQDQLFSLNVAREQEAAMLRGGSAISADPLADLEAIQHSIIGFGEQPDYNGALNLALSYANRFAIQDRLQEVQEICEWAMGMPGSSEEHLRLVARLARITARADAQGATGEQHQCMSQAIRAALQHNWSDALWNMVSALREAPEPEWWYDLVNTIRRQALGEQAGDVQPVMIARRALLTLQSIAEKMEHANGEINHGSLARLQALTQHLREESIPNWLHIDPSPPHSHLGYSEIDELLEEIGAFLPEARLALDRALSQPRIQAQRVLEDWENGGFADAAEGLRELLLWDPDRKRVLRADEGLERAPAWLEKIHKGPGPGEHYQAFVMDIEFTGRELRNQVGQAGWLDLVLEGCRQLRKGAWPPDLFTSLPLLVREMPWLRRYERRERLPAAALADNFSGLVHDPLNLAAIPFAVITGNIRGRLGADGDLCFESPLDAWIAEARGSSARVYGGKLRDTQGNSIPAAIKIMRMDKIDYALPLFKEEALIMQAMRGVPGMTALYESGFLRIENGGKLPEKARADSSQEDITLPTGSLIRIGPNHGQEFVNQIEARIADGWTPYLAFEVRDSEDNLLRLCDSGMTGGSYRPVAQLLLMSIQICDILQEAHNRKIVYRDHKVLHYYWLDSTQGIYVIDWNVARLHPDGISDYEKQMDLVQFGARALHHILTGRTAPGALPLGPTRPEEIEQAAKTYQAQWTYDDQRLPEDLQAILERVLAGDYNSAIQLRDDLKQVFLNLPDV